MRRLRPWLLPAGMVAGCLVVWWGLDRPRFAAWYVEALGIGGRLALLGLVGVALWSLANRDAEGGD